MVFALASSIAHAQAPAKGETIRPEVGKPLQAAQELMKAQKPRDALGEIQKADAVPNKTPFESYLVERLRGMAAVSAGDVPTAVKSFEVVIASGRLTPAELQPIVQALAGNYYRAKDYPKAIAWASRYFKEGGDDLNMRAMLIHSYYLSDEFDSAAQEALADINAEEKAGRKPPEDRLQLLANSYLKMKDESRYAYALEKLVSYYPKKEYWADLIARTQRKPTFADRMAPDVFRLKLATGTMSDPEDYLEMAQLALQSGFPAEAKQALDKGYAAGILGAGPNAERHRKMREMVEKEAVEDRKALAQKGNEAKAEAARDGLALLNLGYAYVLEGQYDKGIAFMERGLAKGTKKPQDARLHIGIAYLKAGQKEKAFEIFRNIGGVHGAADMGRLWSIHAKGSQAGELR